MTVKSKKATRKGKTKAEANGAPEAPLKQNWIPGTEPEIIPKIEEAANEFYNQRIAKREANEKLHDDTLVLIDRMREQGLTEYQNADGFIFKINQNQAMKCKKKKKAKHPVTGVAD